MSEIKVNSIKGVGASAAAITVNNTDGTCTANITNNLSNRNLIINGAMQVAQRGTSSTASGFATLDRFLVLHSGTDESPTQAQVDVTAGTTPYTLGFRKALKVTNGNQTSGAGNSDYILINYKSESQDIANSGWNYTDPNSFITFSYWVKSSVAQNFYVRTVNNDTPQQRYAFETGSLTANTWTKITKTIPGNSNLVFNNDNGIGLYFRFYLWRGTDHTSNSVNLNQWETHNSSQNVPDNTTTWYTTNDATFEMTGVQLEVGSVATDFEHKSFAQELLLCQRYYQQVGSTDTNLGGDFPMFVGYTYNNGLRIASSHTTNVKMRTTPTMAEIGNGMSIYGQGNNGTVASIFTIMSADDTNLIAFTVDATSSQDFGGIDKAMTVTNKTGGGVSFSAEL